MIHKTIYATQLPIEFNGSNYIFLYLLNNLDPESSTVHRLQQVQNFLRVIGCFGDFPPVFDHLTIGTYQHGGTNYADLFFAIHHLLTPGAVLGHHLFFRI